MTSRKQKNWKGKTGGTLWMQRSLIYIYKVVGLRPMYAVMALVVPFYMLFSHKGYLSAYRFFRQRMNYGRLRSFINVYKNHFVFGQIIIDRFAVYAGKKFKLEMEGYDLFLENVRSSKGFIMLSSHVGNYEMAGYSLVSEQKPFHALVYGGETATVMSNRVRIFGGNNIDLIPISDDMSHVFAMSKALADGDILSMSGDRVFGSNKTCRCSFLGSEAAFPIGPYVLARQREVNVLAVFVMKESTENYRVIIKRLLSPSQTNPFATPKEPFRHPKGTLSQPETNPFENPKETLAKSFAAILESIVKQYPTQWFNYYDFWE